jgi:hypothetical protein
MNRTKEEIDTAELAPVYGSRCTVRSGPAGGADGRCLTIGFNCSRRARCVVAANRFPHAHREDTVLTAECATKAGGLAHRSLTIRVDDALDLPAVCHVSRGDRLQVRDTGKQLDCPSLGRASVGALPEPRRWAPVEQAGRCALILGSESDHIFLRRCRMLRDVGALGRPLGYLHRCPRPDQPFAGERPDARNQSMPWAYLSYLSVGSSVGSDPVFQWGQIRFLVHIVSKRC